MHNMPKCAAIDQASPNFADAVVCECLCLLTVATTNNEKDSLNYALFSLYQICLSIFF